ncbi:MULTISPECIES: hypothetical protein [Cyanophyceae]|nr:MULTISPECIES: hypothetical protein [unclassified Trichocoleus]
MFINKCNLVYGLTDGLTVQGEMNRPMTRSHSYIAISSNPK